MAQGGASGASLAAPDAAVRKHADPEAYELQQYAKIVRFRDAVFSGTHPTIKPPDHASSLPQPPSAHAGKAVPVVLKNGTSGGRPTSAKDRHDLPAPSAIQKPFTSKQTKINPILLEKSDELIKAEIDLQRQRLERALREEVEQRRFSKSSQPERNAPLDVSDVLAKALALDPQGAAPSAGEELTTDRDVASDSFDEKTFYSSQHDTPQSQMTSRVRNDSAGPQSSGAVLQPPDPVSQTKRSQEAQAAAAPEPPSSLELRQKDGRRSGLSSNGPTGIPVASLVPGLNNYIGAGTVATPPSQGTASGTQSQSEHSAKLDAMGTESARAHARLPSSSYVHAHPPSPLIRSHALEPVAPQAAQISPLAVAQGNSGPVHAVPQPRGTPAQVAALRQEPSAVTSPDSSSQGGRASMGKKGKKKKRKADRQAPEVDANPYIKPEPRSPSPFHASSHVRASKRRRQSQGPVIELEAEPSYQRSLAHNPDGQFLTRPYRDERVPPGYDSGRVWPQRAPSTAYISDPHYGRGYMDERRLPADNHVRDYAPPGAMTPMAPYPYSPRMAYPPRPVSHTFAGDGYRDPSGSLREFTEGGRLSVRPDGDVYANHLNPPPPRMLVDAVGREYYDPSHPAVNRPGGPPVGPGEPGIMYERMPPRPVSRHPGPEPYGEGSVVYAGAPSAYAMPRRVVTQPTEYSPYDFREGQHREYYPRPVAPPGNFLEFGDGRPVNDAPRGYATRAASMMAVDAVRYEVPPAYGRMHSVRPELSVPEYPGAMQNEGRRDAAQPYLREYAARPLEAYHRPQARGADEIAFIERPRGATQEIVYADDARREIYR